MKSPPTIGSRSLARLVQVFTALLDEVAAGRPDKVAALKREAENVLERALHQLSGKLRPKFTDRNQLAAHLSKVRQNSLQAVVNTISVEHPEHRNLLYIITDPTSPRA